MGLKNAATCLKKVKARRAQLALFLDGKLSYTMGQFTPNLSGRIDDGGDRTAVHHEQSRGSIVFQDRPACH
jgi:hypothetical protein